MHLHHLKHATFDITRGVLLTLIAVILQWGGYLNRVESGLRDERVIHCQNFRPPPTKSLVHLDVDDNALSNIGHWPWEPTKMARIVDEIALTKPKLMAFDVIFAEPTKTIYGPNDSTGVNGDQVLADSLSKLGCALIPMSLHFEDNGPASRVNQALLPALIDDPELNEEQCRDLLRMHRLDDNGMVPGTVDSFISLRESAFYERIWKEVAKLNGAVADPVKIKQAILPHADPLFRTVLDNLFDQQFDRVLRERTMLRFTLPVGSSKIQFVKAHEEIAPILPLARATAYSGFVDYLPESVEGTVRSVPLLVQYRDRLVPQVGLVAACAELGVDIQRLRLSTDSLTLPVPGGKDVVIPVSVRDSTIVGSVAMLMEVPLFGRARDWITMYDFPRYEKPAQHVSIYEVWSVCETAEKLARNQQFLDINLGNALKLLAADKYQSFQDSPPVGEARRQLIRDTLDGPEGTAATIKNFEGDPDFKASADRLRVADTALRNVVKQNSLLQAQLVDQRSGLRDKLHDRVIFLGGTATSLSDLRPTSLFGSSPGVVVHGAIYSAIVTNKMWRLAPLWIGWVITAVIGLLTLLLVMILSPAKGFAAALGLALGYLAFNGYYLLAYKNLLVAAAGPLVAVGMVWSGMTLTSFLSEIAERSRITKRFSSYVDPILVKHMVDHPDHVRFDGQKLEVTTCFSDLAGFTTLTDQMGEKIVPLLSEYMGHMIPVIREHHGYVSQMAGDGIYYIFGAPQILPNHAELAVNAGFGMYRALADFNVILKQRGLAQLGMRIGMSTGEVIVGDTGSKEVSAYTAMGASVNLSSRLESANKVFGSRMLITARTVELLNGSYLVRPLANLRVAGKLNSVVVSEPLCLMSQATESDRLLAEMTTRVFEAYRVADFHGCIAAAGELEQAFGATKFTKLYQRLATEHLDHTAPAEHFEGQIALTEK